ncbi:MAG: hypothetical protein ACOCT0_06195 [Halobacteriota archaeon]
MQALDAEVTKLKRMIEEEPDEDRMLLLAEKIKSDHTTVQRALEHAEISERDRKKLLRLAREV